MSRLVRPVESRYAFGAAKEEECENEDAVGAGRRTCEEAGRAGGVVKRRREEA